MDVFPVDPRDTQWEVSHPTYRVTFWRRDAKNQHSPGWVAEEWSIKGADIDQVLIWARDNAQTRSFIIYANITDPDGPGLIRLFGTDPTAAT
jgi:hypothetical protein